MANEKTQSGKKQVSIGLTWSAAGRGRAVVVSRERQQLRLLASRPVASAEQWKDLLRQYGADKSARPVVSVGLGSSQVGFYNFDVPPVSAEQLALVVRSQAEGCLPLPLEKMRFTWRADAREGGRRCIVAAVRREMLDQVQGVLGGGPRAVVPDVQALVRGWQACYKSRREPTILLAASGREAVTVLTQGTTIHHVLRVDMDPDPSSAGLWMSDIVQAVRTQQAVMPGAAVVLMDLGSNLTDILEAQLEREGLGVSRSGPDEEKLRRLGFDDPASAAEHPAETALALMGLDEERADFDFLRPEATGEPGKAAAGMRWTRVAVHVLAAAALLTAGMYWKDRAELKSLEATLSQSAQGKQALELLERQDYRRQIAKVRPDLLELLTMLQETQPAGVFFDSLVFELGKPVEVKGQADSYEKVYELHKNLSGKSGISQPRLIEPSMDEKTRKVKFAVQFGYRHFSR